MSERSFVVIEDEGGIRTGPDVARGHELLDLRFGSQFGQPAHRQRPQHHDRGRNRDELGEPDR